MKPNFSFSPKDFKKWMEDQNITEDTAKPQNNLVGMTVESKINSKRLLARIESKEGDPHELISDFKHNGGTIYDVDDQRFLIEVERGFFYIPRFLVKKIKE
jgi:chromosome condensin MukBEF MukE localization factor